MDIQDLIRQLDWPLRIALGGLLLSTLVWLFSMLIAIVTKPKASGLRKSEITASVFAILIAVSMAFVGRAMTAEPEADGAAQEAPARSGGTGTCASIRAGMTAQDVRALLGTPAIDRSNEDARGPGAHVMAFSDSRCTVHLIHGRVDQVE